MIASGLLSQGHDVRVVTVGDAAGVEQYKGVEVHIMRSPNVYWDYFFTKRSAALKMVWHVLENFNPRAYIRLRPHLKAFQPDVVMTVSIENTNVATWLLARMHKVPVVHVIQSYFLACWRGGLFKNGSNCAGQCGSCKVLSVGKKPLSQLVDGVFGETRFVVDQHLQLGYFKQATSTVIPGPVFPIAGRVPKARDGKLVVGYMGVLAPHKGVDVLADAARLMGPGSNVRFLIGGTGEDEAYVASLREKFGDADVQFMGWVKPDDVYPLFDVLVVPSKWKEPFGRIVVEALAYGVPVICARSGGIAESIRENENGYTFASGQHDELITLLRDVLEPDEPARMRLAENALQHSHRFDIGAIAARISDFVTATVAGYKARR
ncbi:MULTISPECIES: glycosyltransferase [unclassified Janthinobacterium]|uniref:glycosyltransferase n=1 Tax=unclassified Janthinobacterium TaxID=2610881 RepID=UPI001619E105|nr:MULTISPECIES: glycosyltransferase [unclassified Janthinobacterium]MBB5609739.1 glycosyltransferase involved in cell wall biosynthesis [Janthinobacterium sp. S3T4]MBB5614911.1 glycosyltransferase involved in cell wall biosynthesis [Janthinobacterium sp. S3M3]